MLRLKKQTESRWIDLPNGVRIKVRPLSTAYLTAARSEAVKRIAAMQKEEEDKVAAGFPVDPSGPTFANANFRNGVAQQMLAETLLRYLGEEWEGVGDENGEPLPIDAASAQAFAALDDMAAAFLAAVLAPLDAVSAEGNGFAPGSPSSGPAGGMPAPDAAMADAGAAPLN